MREPATHSPFPHQRRRLRMALTATVYNFDIELAESHEAEARLKAMCERLLANTVIEDFSIDSK